MRDYFQRAFSKVIIRCRCLSIILVLIVVSAVPNLWAVQVGISLGTVGSVGNGDILDLGTHAQLGLLFGIAPRWELEAFMIGEVTPDPFGSLVGGAGATFALLGPVHGLVGSYPDFVHLYVSAGIMVDTLDLKSWVPYVRFTPLSVGGSWHGVRERLGGIGVFYNVGTQRLTDLWNLFFVDLFPIG